MELETSSRNWSPDVILPFAWSTSPLPGEDNLFANLSVAGKASRRGVLAPRLTIHSHPGMGPAMDTMETG